MNIDDIPSTEERYSSASRSSHLHLSMEHRCDVDTLIAAGLVKDSFATQLWRLKTEFDTVRASTRRDALNQTERLLILSQLKTLSEARRNLGGFAIVYATRGKHMINDETALKLAGRVLDVFLDPLCHHCDGRGFTGGRHRGEMQTVCRPCRGSGQRLGWIGQTPQEQAFASGLLAEMEREQATLAIEVRRNHELVEEAKRRIVEETKIV